jgi:cytochrome oxidase assembly protein ShyY1
MGSLEIAGLIVMIFVYAVALGFGIWQLVSVRREIRRDKEAQKDREP